MKSKFSLRAIIVALTLASFFSACNGDNEVSRDMILGEWYNESLEVRYDAAQGGDSLFRVPVGQWEAVLKIKPIQTIYADDGTYMSKYWDLDGTLVREAGGEWELAGDTLYLTEGGVKTGYHFKWMEGRAVFTGYLDWDSDGREDDLYEGVQIKK